MIWQGRPRPDEVENHRHVAARRGVEGRVASTLGLGEHYAVDLIAAVPFTAWLVERQWAFRLGPVGDDIAANSESA